MEEIREKDEGESRVFIPEDTRYAGSLAVCLRRLAFVEMGWTEGNA